MLHSEELTTKYRLNFKFVSVKERILAYLRAINNGFSIRQPGNRCIVNRKFGDQPNIRPSAPPHKTAHRTHFKGRLYSPRSGVALGSYTCVFNHTTVDMRWSMLDA